MARQHDDIILDLESTHAQEPSRLERLNEDQKHALQKTDDGWKQQQQALRKAEKEASNTVRKLQDTERQLKTAEHYQQKNQEQLSAEISTCGKQPAVTLLHTREHPQSDGDTININNKRPARGPTETVPDSKRTHSVNQPLQPPVAQQQTTGTAGVVCADNTPYEKVGDDAAGPQEQPLLLPRPSSTTTSPHGGVCTTCQDSPIKHQSQVLEKCNRGSSSFPSSS